jgi:Major Facilitator Superfamily
MPESDTEPELPFKFTGGFGMSTKNIGLVLSCQGLMQMVAQLIIFPAVTKRVGPLGTFRIAIFAYPLLYLIVPYISLAPHHLRIPAIAFVLLWKVMGQAFSYPSNNLMLVDHAPSPRVLGTLNGIASSAASLARAFGPTLAGSLQAAGLSIGYSGIAWWTCSVIAVGGVVVSLYQRHVPKVEPQTPVTEIIADEETGLAAPILSAFIDRNSEDGNGETQRLTVSTVRL